jgi:hypothetical protein
VSDTFSPQFPSTSPKKQEIAQAISLKELPLQARFYLPCMFKLHGFWEIWYQSNHLSGEIFWIKNKHYKL